MNLLTPECDKIHDVRKESQTIGEFLDWLVNQGILLCEYSQRKVRCDSCGEMGELGFVQHRESIEQLLARFFIIDLDKAEAERCAILADLRKEKP